MSLHLDSSGGASPGGGLYRQWVVTGQSALAASWPKRVVVVPSGRGAWGLLGLLLATLAALPGCSRQDFTRPIFPNIERQATPMTLPREAYSAAPISPADVEATLARWRAQGGADETTYRLGTGDVLSLSIFGVQEVLPGAAGPGSPIQVKVDDAGNVRLPLVGDVHAGGLTPLQLQQELQNRYAQQFQGKPEVRLDVVSYGSRRVYITGAVNTPGTQTLAPGKTDLLSVLADAGWLNPTAGDTVTILRRSGPAAEPAPATGPAGGQSIKIDLHQLLDQGHMELNLQLQDRDVVNVAEREEQRVNVLGYVNLPVSILLPKTAYRIPVTEALASAGGLTRFARAENSFMVRANGDTQEVYNIDLLKVMRGETALWLRSGDTLVVGSAWDARLMESLATLTSGVGSVTRFGAAR